MPVPSSIADLSQTAGSNYPAGSESPSTIDDYLRVHASYIAQLRDGKGASAEAEIASAATVDIGAANSPFINITGTTTITSFGTNYNGPRYLRFTGALTLTHNATTLILPGAADVTVVAGDTCVVVPNGNPANGWRVAASSGASLVGYTPSGSGSVPTTVEKALQQRLTTFDKMTAAEVADVVAGTMGIDVTTDFQKALDYVSSVKGALTIKAGTYLLGPVFVKSNTLLIFEPGVVLMARPGFGVNERFFNIYQANNVAIAGNFATIKMPKAEYTTGEQRHCVFITSSTNVAISNLNANDSGGDGFYLGDGGTGPCQNIALLNCNADNNRRNNMSIVSAIDLWVNGGKFTNAQGADPQAGIDVEPNAGCTIRNVNLVKVKTKGNYGCGILVVPLGAGSVSGAYMTVNIDGHESENDAIGLSSAASLRFDNGATPANKINGRILAKNCTSILSNGPGLMIGSISWTNCPELIVQDMKIINPGTTATPSTSNAAGVSMNTGSALNHVDGVTLRRVYCEDTRGTPKMYVPFYLSGNGSYKVNNTLLEDCDGANYLLADGPFLMLGGATNLVFRQNNPRLQTFAAGNFSVSRYAGLLLTQSGNGVLTLNGAASYPGIEYEFVNTVSSTMQVRPLTGEIINWYGLAINTDLVSRTVGSRLKLKSLGAAGWSVVAITGDWAPLGYSAPGKVVYGTAAPTTGTWARGDRLINSSPAVGSPKSWVCTASGTPGTWVSEGNL